MERAPTLTRLTDGLNISALSQERGSMTSADDAGDHRWRHLERAVHAQRVGGGGETSGACVQALGITQLRIGPQIDPGVPWCHAVTPARPTGLQLALKSGNFGGADFFSRADTLV